VVHTLQSNYSKLKSTIANHRKLQQTKINHRKPIQPKLPYILHIETATEICSVALSKGNVLLSHQESSVSNQHSSQLTLLIQAAMAEANVPMTSLQAVALSSGPGSYTSLRVGTSVAKGICYALSIPLIAIDTLHSLAVGAKEDIQDDEALYCPMIDARRMECYIALYDAAGNELRAMEARIIDESFRDELFALNKKIIFSGSGAEKCRTFLDQSTFVFSKTVCNSANMLNIAYQKFTHFIFEDIAYFSPEYLKAPNITQSKKVL
jgi:tRNA threonylcarbamoyladenosine biosynthesis protein TsaB